ncbi:MAG: prephenate dehydrogenase/arogenate dehydrogenase family protein [Burkholderiaceae bacterium]|nr:prephenate dehydrogenase/arogenate dehydrogenase family protein [Burkholderiaceae bacterium]
MKLALIGIGLIGGSLARAAKARGNFNRIIGFDSQSEALLRALGLGVIDEAATSVAQAVVDADLVMIATPVGSIRQILREIAPNLRSAAIVTDVGSTKGSVIEAAREELGAAFARFVPGHPIAGSEHSGFEHSDAALFAGKLFISTPVEQTDARAVVRIEALWHDVGCHIERMTPTEHDNVFAAVSHLPHLLAFALVAHIAGQADADRKFAMAGAGFRDFTRIAASSPSMWSDICIANRVALGNELRSHRELLEGLQRAIDVGDRQILELAFLTATNARR